MDRKIRGMTLRELTGLALLVGLLLAGLFVSWYLGRQQEALARELSDSSWLALSGQLENAKSKAEEARDRWKAGWNPLAALADHEPMKKIDSLFEELTVYGAAGDRTEFARVCAQLADQLGDLGNTQKLTWWNLM